MSGRRNRPLWVVAALTALSLALLGCGSGQATTGHGRPAHRPSGRDGQDTQAQPQPPAAGRAAFAWFRPAAAPAAWLRASLPGQGATLSYPNTLRPVHGDHGTVSFGLDAASGKVLVYLNATPQQGGESLQDWPSFRLKHLREDGEHAVHVEGVSPSLSFRGGHGRCLIDNYTTDIHSNHYQEIACFVRGSHSASVLVAATSAGMWRTYQSLLDRVVSTYQAG